MNRSRHSGRRSTWAVVLAAVAIGCGGTPGARPDDMSAAAHRREATAHEAEAEAQAEQYDPEATRLRTTGGRSDLSVGESEYNPTEVHRIAAERHQQHAEDHRLAAEALEQFEEAECGSFAPSTRALCPLLGQVASTERSPKGVRVHFVDGANVEAIEAHVRCHIAFARTHGREGMDECPLYVEGVRVENSGPDGMDLVVDDPEAAQLVQQRTETHVTGP